MKSFKLYCFLFSIIFFLNNANSQNNQWIHSYIRVDNHWDPTQEQLRFLVCADSLIQSADVTTSLQINGNTMTISSIHGGIVSVTNPGDTVRIVFTATHIPSSRVYAFDAQIITHLITPSIQYFSVPANNQALPMSILTTKKNASGSSLGKVNLNISGGLPFAAPTDLYAIRWKLNNTSVAGNFTDSLLNLQGGSTFNASFRDNWFHCSISGGIPCCDTINSVWVCDTLCFPTCGNSFFCYDGVIDLLDCSAMVSYSYSNSNSNVYGAINYFAYPNFAGVSYGIVNTDESGPITVTGAYSSSSIPFVCPSTFNYINATYYHLDGTDVYCAGAQSADNVVLMPDCTLNLTVALDSGGNYTLNVQDIDNGTDFIGHPALVLNTQLSQTYFTCADTGIQQVILTVTADCSGWVVGTESCTTTVNVLSSVACINNTIPSIITLPTISPNSWNEGTSPSINIPFEAEGNYNSGNTFIAEISDSTGSFANSIALGSISSSQNGTLNITGIAPNYLTASSQYKIRVRGTSPVTIGTEVDKIMVLNAVGVQEELMKSIKIFPNPASEFFYINSSEEMLQVSLLDLSGRVIKIYARQSSSFDIRGLAAGVYFVQFLVNGTSVQSKLIVQ